MANLQNYNGRYCESEFEYAFLSFLEAEGWHYLHGNSIPRENKTAVLYADDMEQFLNKTNSDLTSDEIHQRGLSAARGAHDGQVLSPLHRKVYIFQNSHRFLALLVVLTNVRHCENGHYATSLSASCSGCVLVVGTPSAHSSGSGKAT